ncbi:hypothetical protein Pan216_25980 [Planctomycetes bacterium Pan216]|uniref:TIGR03067 domain-containing protein n=1 Tax=Kolteria novifilia TaxID=2527975 RepID=A0A518B430_9BACT|nr:hypothetical protein Pan216_25980 [Planctomycetes bacterium Pan216]
MRSLFVALGLMVALGTQAFAEESDEQAFQGTWRLVGGEMDGKPLDEEQLKGGKLVIKGNHYTATLADMGTVTGTQKLDPTTKPKSIDITHSSGRDKGKTFLGIYESNGDQTRVAFSALGKPRPKTFSTKSGTGSWVHVWERVKK